MPLSLSASDRRRLQRWFARHGREDLPWRASCDPYEVLVSEVMLQQTQVSRVLSYYLAWIERWPTVDALAKASAADVIRAWAGLGYNRRALRLREAAVAVVSNHGGTFPISVSELQALSGVGAYTAAAVACFASEVSVPVIDTNIARVLARSLFGAAGADEVAVRQIHNAAAESLPRRGTRSHNLALMDLGATLCRARTPECGRCPLRTNCNWRTLGYPRSTAKQNRATPKFQTTARFARGRIVALLRDARSLSSQKIEARLPQAHRSKLTSYLDGLERDGLIERHARGWRLPEIS